MTPIGVDEWVARSDERRDQGTGWRRSARARRRARRLVAATGAGHGRGADLRPDLDQREHPDGRLQLPAVRAAGDGAQHRGRMVGPARSRLHRVLRLRRLRLRDLLLVRARERGRQAVPIWLRSSRSRSWLLACGVVGVVVGLIALRLSGDYFAIVTLFVGSGVRLGRQQRRSGDARRRQRPVRPGSIPQLRRDRHHAARLLLPGPGGDRGRRRSAAPARHLSYGPSMARAERRPAGRRGDDDVRQQAQGDGVQLRRDGRRPRGHDFRRPAGQRFSDELHRQHPDPDLRVPGARRRGQHRRRDPGWDRRDGGGELCSRARRMPPTCSTA